MIGRFLLYFALLEIGDEYYCSNKPKMTGRINIVQRVVAAIAIAVETLRIIGRLDNGLGGSESPQLWVIVSRPHID